MHWFQILDLLITKQIQHSSEIANCCITALFEYNHDVCLKNIMEVICDPLLLNSKIEQDVIKSEFDVEKCIECLVKCFITEQAKFKCLPCELLMNTAVPLFCLYNDVRRSACSLKLKIKQLILRVLHEESSRNNLFAAFLGHNSTKHFGHRLVSRFAPSGGIEITGTNDTIKYEECADSLFDLTSTTKELLTELFSYLLKFLSSSMELDNRVEVQNLLATEDDAMENIEKQMAAVKLLSNLANTSAVQQAQIENPKSILSLVKSLFHRYTKKRESSSGEDDCEILYVSLMLVKMIISERKKPLNSIEFSDFVKFLKEGCTLPCVSMQLSLLMKELIQLIETQGRPERKYYQDLSVNNKTSNKFEEALKDLADPLLPVRAHGLITLTKLIDSMDPYATARKAVILQLFKVSKRS